MILELFFDPSHVNLQKRSKPAIGQVDMHMEKLKLLSRMNDLDTGNLYRKGIDQSQLRCTLDDFLLAFQAGN